MLWAGKRCRGESRPQASCSTKILMGPIISHKDLDNTVLYTYTLHV